MSDTFHIMINSLFSVCPHAFEYFEVLPTHNNFLFRSENMGCCKPFRCTLSMSYAGSIEYTTLYLSICINGKRLRTSFKIQGSINVLCEGGLKRQTGVIQVYIDRQYNNKLFLESMFKCLSMKYMIYDKKEYIPLEGF